MAKTEGWKWNDSDKTLQKQGQKLRTQKNVGSM